MPQLNTIPNYPIRLTINGETTKDWYFFWAGLFRGIPPAIEAAVTADPSPYVFSATARGSLIIEGGTVTSVEFSRDGVTFYDTGVTAGMFPVNSSDQLRITYAVAPNLTFVPT